LDIGRIYFGLAYEDDDLKYPIVHSYEYLGLSGGSSDVHSFRFLGTGDLLELTDGQLDLIFGVDGLKEALKAWARENPALAGEG
jgi:hypothetical protein